MEHTLGYRLLHLERGNTSPSDFLLTAQFQATNYTLFPPTVFMSLAL